VSFGSPAWSQLALWRLRWRWVISLQANFYLHYSDANNSLFVQVASTGTSVALIHRVAGVNTTVATATGLSLANVTFYWLLASQYPGAPGNPPYLSVTLLADSAGAPGSTLATLSGPAASDTVALSGQMSLEAIGGNLQLGGPFASVHTVSLFGPGGWALSPAAGSSVVSGAWEGNGTNSNPGGNGQPPA